MEDAAFCPTEKKKINTSDTFINQRHFNWFRLDSDGAYKVHKCTSSISLYCGFKELRYAHKCTSAHNNISLQVEKIISTK